MPSAQVFPFPEQDDLFAPISPSRWQGKDPPRREWMVEGAFPKASVVMVSGDGGVGKSLLMQQLCTCAALGKPWLGLRVEPGRAVLLACEDDHDELWRRQYAINRHLSREMDDVAEGGLILAPRVGQDNAMFKLNRSEWQMLPTKLFQAVEARCRLLGVTYVIFDTATQVFSGNQNDERLVMQFIAGLRRLAMAIEGLVVITKHPSLSGRASGSGEGGNVAWHNSVRARWYLHNHKTHGLVFETKKSNYGPADQRISLKYSHGVFVRVDPVTREPIEEAGQLPL